MKHTELELRQASNVKARELWERKAVGCHRARSPSDSREYFEEIRAYRYGYETPFIPRFFGFSGLAGKRVLEIGVGNGIDAVEMLRGGAIYTGIDITQNHLNLTRRYIAFVSADEFPGRLETIMEGDLLECDLAGNYDLVYSFGVMHHIAHEAEFLRRIHGLLLPGGELRVALYSRYSFFNGYLLVTWLLRNRCANSLIDWKSHVAEGSELGSPVIIKIRSRREIQSMLKENGFEVVSYGKKGFVQGYVPGLGRFLDPDGFILNVLARTLGWYHCFICKRS